MDDLIETLQNWYASQCDEVWEHSYGISIDTLDNPGWSVRIDGVSHKKEMNLKIDRDDDDIDWVNITATESEFDGCGGAKNLKEILILALEWLQSSRADNTACRE